MQAGSVMFSRDCNAALNDINKKWLSDKVYWQVADQPGKEGPISLVMVDSVDKEEKKGLSSLNQERESIEEDVPDKSSVTVAWAMLAANSRDIVGYHHCMI